ncbi:MAG TPA: HAD family hydrolase [Dehalococcoidales bacterium]|nr:HAD family hydrolase [Dehalococcoidales bacterium]
MKYRGVFFDWFNTLAGYEVPRELLYQKVFSRHGIELTLRTIFKGIQRGDRYYFTQGAPLLNTPRTPEALARHYILYAQYIAGEAGLDIPVATQLAIVQQTLSEFSGKMVLFEDVLPAIQELKRKHLKIGVITNADARVLSAIQSSAIGNLVDFVTTSEEAGAEKPDSAIFRQALKKAGLEASETVFTGDQYENDVVGARGAGMDAILLDRWDALPDSPDYIRIQTLASIPALI